MKKTFLFMAGGLLIAGCAIAKSNIEQASIHEVMIELTSPQNAAHNLDQVQSTLSNSKSLNGVQIRSVKKGKLSLDVDLDKCLSRETMDKEMKLAQFVAPMITAMDANPKAAVIFEKIAADGKWPVVAFFSSDSSYDCVSRIAINSYVKR